MFISRGNEMPALFDMLDKVKCPVIVFFGGKDKLIPLEHVDKIEAELARCGVPYAFYRYADGGHAFSNFGTPEEYRAEASVDSWRRTIEFLAQHLNPGKAGPVSATSS